LNDGTKLDCQDRFISKCFITNWCYELSSNLIKMLPGLKARKVLASKEYFRTYLEESILNSFSNDDSLEPNLKLVQRQIRRKSHHQVDTNRTLIASNMLSQQYSSLYSDVILNDTMIIESLQRTEV
jgi:hypothetical protein